MDLKTMAKQSKPAMNKIMVNMMIVFYVIDQDSGYSFVYPYLPKECFLIGLFWSSLSKPFTNNRFDRNCGIKHRFGKGKKPSHYEKLCQNGVVGY